MYPKSDAQPYLPELLHDTSSLDLSDDSGRNTEGLDDKNMKLEMETFSSNEQSEVETSPNASDKVSPIDNDRFGMMGLLSSIQAANSRPNLETLPIGMNINELGLNLNARGSLYGTFGGPFSHLSCLPQHDDFHVPPEYMINLSIRNKLAGFNLSRFKDDALFFLFYGSVGDSIQLQSAAELYKRNWRYNIEEKVWLYRMPGITDYRKIGSIEQGTFYYFDPKKWRRVAREFQFDSDKIEKCPIF